MRNYFKNLVTIRYPGVPPFIILACFLASCACTGSARYRLDESEDAIRVGTDHYVIRIQKQGFRYAILDQQGELIAPPHQRTGLVFGGSGAMETAIAGSGDSTVLFRVLNEEGDAARISLQLFPEYFKFTVIPDKFPSDLQKQEIILRTGGISPAFGLGEHGGYPKHPCSPAGTELTGYSNDTIIACIGDHFVGRMISNFVVFPRAGLAEANVEPWIKIVRLTRQENVQGSNHRESLDAMYYFIGDMHTIYRNFLEVRNRSGHPFMKPKYELFGVGWEAWGALAWRTNQASVTETVSEFIEKGYPLSWGVVGSGFWPKMEPQYLATTSFGLWDTLLYPDPAGLFRIFHEHGMKVLVGLRIAFLKDGPYTGEGLEHGYFIRENGLQKIFKIGFPRGPVYLLDAQNPEAVEWYVTLCQKWLDCGIDGFKEDIFGYHWNVIRDDKCDPVNEALMKKGVYIMGRNAYLGSVADIHRFEDFNFDHQQDRGPISSLAFAYSGFPFVYPDVVGGNPNYGEGVMSTDRFRNYLMRFAWFAAMNPSMAFGMGPWKTGDPEVSEITLKAARIHDGLHPYIYSAAIETWKTGFPWTLTPLPLKFPDDPNVYNREDSITRGYQWMIGRSLLACPLYGNDYATANSRDVYLPAGKWVDFETGEIYEGQQMLKDFPLPVSKTPLFVGGNGMLLWKDPESGNLLARIYRVSAPGTAERFTMPDRSGAVEIGNRVGDWNAELKLRSDGKTQRMDLIEDKYVSFPVRAGKRYVLSN